MGPGRRGRRCTPVTVKTRSPGCKTSGALIDFLDRPRSSQMSQVLCAARQEHASTHSVTHESTCHRHSGRECRNPAARDGGYGPGHHGPNAAIHLADPDAAGPCGRNDSDPIPSRERSADMTVRSVPNWGSCKGWHSDGRTVHSAAHDPYRYRPIGAERAHRLEVDWASV